jgi:serine protease Do
LNPLIKDDKETFVIKRNWTQAATAVVLSSALVSGLALIPAGPVLAQSSSALVRGLPDFTELVERVGPSVVNIRTLEKARTTAPAPGGADEEMQELFRRFFWCADAQCAKAGSKT